MDIKQISQKALDTIDEYKNFKFGNAVCSIPYFNNKRVGARMAFRVAVGKGSARDIYEEVEQKTFKEKIDAGSFTVDSLKKYLVDNNIGIDCSGFAYYILNEESLSRGVGPLDKNLAFPFRSGFFGKIRCKMRPVENAGVQTFAHDKNSKVIELKDVQVGDMITMVGGSENGERDHVLVIYKIEYENSIPTVLYYAHAVRWPTDGEYGHGIHEGIIKVGNVNGKIIERVWTENGKTGAENYTFIRGQKSVTEVRRLGWF